MSEESNKQQEEKKENQNNSNPEEGTSSKADVKEDIKTESDKTEEVQSTSQEQESQVAQEEKEIESQESEVVEKTTEEISEPQTKVLEEAKLEDAEEVSEEKVTDTKPEEISKENATAKGDKELNSEDDLHSDDDDDEDDEDHEEELPDYSEYSREQLAEAIEELPDLTTFRRTDRILTEIVPLFEEKEHEIRQAALDKYKAEGGEEDTFEFRHDEIFNRFDASHQLIKDRKHSFFKEKQESRGRNLEKKQELLEQLRELIDGENATTSIKPIKDIQEAWKQVGPVPGQHNKTLWANYNALLDRFFNNRHILFELKELDRKKNLEAKKELCEKAEALNKLDNIKEAVIQLNELHEEYKHVGPVPKEVQEELWQRFKAASDEIYKKRKVYLDSLKGELKENLVKKEELVKELEPFLDFTSDRINNWNAKTKEILALQKKWDAIGGIPREKAKAVNKAFWGTFKKFFANKNDFFKTLEGQRKENLEKKIKLAEEAEAVQNSEDWEKTADVLKGLQRKWKDIGPVPEKKRNETYERFKAACDTFFNNRRTQQNKAEEKYVVNQEAKEGIIKALKAEAKAGNGSEEDLMNKVDEFNQIGFVPRNAIKKIEKEFSDAIEVYVSSLDLDENETESLTIRAEMSGIQSGPGGNRRLNKKESTVRRKINELEDNISLWRNNLTFFANSKTADKLTAEFNQKIEAAQQEVKELKKQLKILRSL